MNKILVVIMLSVVFLGGCAGMFQITKWECETGGSCISRQQATNKCLAQANSAYSKNKSLIWEQCMRGEGFEQRPCQEYERNREYCQVIHVW